MTPNGCMAGGDVLRTKIIPTCVIRILIVPVGMEMNLVILPPCNASTSARFQAPLGTGACAVGGLGSVAKLRHGTSANLHSSKTFPYHHLSLDK